MVDRRTYKFNRARTFALVFLVVAVMTLPLLLSQRYLFRVLINIFFFAALGSAWNIIGGYAGQLSLGHAAFVAIGAYTTGLLMLHYNVPPWAGVLPGVILTAVVAYFLGISLLAGARVDRHPLVGVNFSPRGSMIYAPTSNNTFRVSIGRAFRNPSFTDSYIAIEYPPQPPEMPVPVQIVGEPDLESEKMTTYELGYVYFPRHDFRWEIDVFAYKFSDYIVPGALDFSSGLPVQSYVNLGSATAYGFELSADLIPAGWLKFSANYSYQDLNNKYTVLKQQVPPKNKVNFKSFLSLPSGISASFSASFVGKTIWEIATPKGDYQVTETGSHTRCDTRLAYSPGKKNLGFFLAVFNLFNSRHMEYPLGEKLERRATAGMSFSF